MHQGGEKGLYRLPLPRGAYAFFYNTCVISDVFWSFQIF